MFDFVCVALRLALLFGLVWGVPLSWALVPGWALLLLVPGPVFLVLADFLWCSVPMGVVLDARCWFVGLVLCVGVLEFVVCGFGEAGAGSPVLYRAAGGRVVFCGYFDFRCLCGLMVCEVVGCGGLCPPLSGCILCRIFLVPAGCWGLRLDSLAFLLVALSGFALLRVWLWPGPPGAFL
ncbi:hypothetical protein [Phyllobacterium sp. CL33Tsu]|uniref:hypothetical protein n=1 Tax=Phyllobacterium sp. CL33Tsu TaxID=1798191 RepID=UPI0011141497|nr:hypothetical protein [Phyllobacterium sp. CL33Tsu]